MVMGGGGRSWWGRVVGFGWRSIGACCSLCGVVRASVVGLSVVGERGSFAMMGVGAGSVLVESGVEVVGSPGKVKAVLGVVSGQIVVAGAADRTPPVRAGIAAAKASDVAAPPLGNSLGVVAVRNNGLGVALALSNSLAVMEAAVDVLHGKTKRMSLAAVVGDKRLGPIYVARWRRLGSLGLRRWGTWSCPCGLRGCRLRCKRGGWRSVWGRSGQSRTIRPTFIISM